MRGFDVGPVLADGGVAVNDAQGHDGLGGEHVGDVFFHFTC